MMRRQSDSPKTNRLLDLFRRADNDDRSESRGKKREGETYARFLNARTQTGMGTSGLPR
ncbi:hypothetical protein KRX56_01550 [Dermabacteraceae bacterium TAE3-ERU27]|nr:hypothetical protein [Dermabacteraceae bacterium TAE3-ERU27]